MTITEIILDFLKAHLEIPITKKDILSELPSYGFKKFNIMYNDTDYEIKLNLLLNDKGLLKANKLIIGDVITKKSKKGFYIREL